MTVVLPEEEVSLPVGSGPSVAFVTYSIKPRGGVVHTLAVAEALGAPGRPRSR